MKYNDKDYIGRPSFLVKDDYIPMFKGRPERETIISEDDILNIKITLEAFKDVSEFIKRI